MTLKPPPGFELEAPNTPEIKPPDGFQLERPPTQAAPAAAKLERPSSMARRVIGDTAVDLARGVIGVGQAAVGLADIPTGGYAGKALEAIGYDAEGAKEFIGQGYSHEREAAQQKVNEATGFIGTAKAMLENPSTIAGMVAESAPLMLGGGAIARGLGAVKSLASPVIRAAIGEGAAGAGATAEHLRGQSDDGLLSAQQTVASIGSGVGTGLLGAVGGKVAQRLGIADVDTALAGGNAGAALPRPGIVRRGLEGVLAEGVLEELPQSAQEQAWNNYATGRPLAEGVPEAAAQGLLAGAAMGGPVAVLARPGQEGSTLTNGVDAGSQGENDGGLNPEGSMGSTLTPAPTPAAPAAPVAAPTAPIGTLQRVEQRAAEIGAIPGAIPQSGAIAGSMAAVGAASPALQSDAVTFQSPSAAPLGGGDSFTDRMIAAGFVRGATANAAQAPAGTDQATAAEPFQAPPEWVEVLLDRARSGQRIPGAADLAESWGIPIEQSRALRKQALAQFTEESKPPLNLPEPVDGQGNASGAAPSALPVVGSTSPAVAVQDQAGSPLAADAGADQSTEVDTGDRNAAVRAAEPAVADAAAGAPAQGLTFLEDGTPAYDESPDILDDDVTPPSGGALENRGAAELQAKRHEGGRVFPVGGGFVVRVPTQPAAEAPDRGDTAQSSEQSASPDSAPQALQGAAIPTQGAQADNAAPTGGVAAASGQPSATPAVAGEGQSLATGAAQEQTAPLQSEPDQADRRSQETKAARPSQEATPAAAGDQAPSLMEAANAATARSRAASAAMDAFPKGAMGLTPDEVKATPEWKAARGEMSRALAAERNANAAVAKARKAKPKPAASAAAPAPHPAPTAQAPQAAAAPAPRASQAASPAPSAATTAPAVPSTGGSTPSGEGATGGGQGVVTPEITAERKRLGLPKIIRKADAVIALRKHGGMTRVEAQLAFDSIDRKGLKSGTRLGDDVLAMAKAKQKPAIAPLPAQTEADRNDLERRAAEQEPKIAALTTEQARAGLAAIGESKPRDLRDPKETLRRQHPDDVDTSLAAATTKAEPSAAQAGTDKFGRPNLPEPIQITTPGGNTYRITTKYHWLIAPTENIKDHDAIVWSVEKREDIGSGSASVESWVRVSDKKIPVTIARRAEEEVARLTKEQQAEPSVAKFSIPDFASASEASQWALDHADDLGRIDKAEFNRKAAAAKAADAKRDAKALDDAATSEADKAKARRNESPEDGIKRMFGESQLKREPFDSEKFHADRDATIKASREAGNVHLDKVPSGVETMRAYTIFDVHHPEEHGVIDTVDNRGNVYVLWADGSEGSLGPSDLKDYAMAKVPRLDVKALNALRRKAEKARVATKEAAIAAERARAEQSVADLQARTREIKPLLEQARNGNKAQREAARAYLEGEIDADEFKAEMQATNASPATAANKVSAEKAADQPTKAKGKAENALESTEPVVTLSGNEVAESLTADTAVQAARVYFRQNMQGKPIHRDGFGDVRVTGKSLDELRRGMKMNPNKVRLLPAIRPVIESGTYEGRKELTKPRKDNIIAFHRFSAPVSLAGEAKTVRVLVGEDKFGNLLYDVFAGNQEPPAFTPDRAGGAEGSGAGVAPTDRNVPRESVEGNDEGVNVEELSGLDITPEEWASFQRQVDEVETNAALRELAGQQSREDGEADADRLGWRKAVNKALGVTGLRVEFMRNRDGLDQVSQSNLNHRNADREVQTTALYLPTEGRVVIFTGNPNRPVHKVVWDAFHEIAGHDGLRKLLGKNLDKALKLAGENATVAKLAAAIGRERNIAPDGLLAIEEALAELAAAVRTGDYANIQARYGVTVPQGIRAQVVAAISEFLRRLKNLLNRQYGKDVFTDQDVRSLLEHAWQAAQSDGATVGGMAESTADEDYRGEHAAPMKDSGAPAHDVTGGGSFYPGDVYSANGPRYYGTGEDRLDAEAFGIVNSLRGRPNASVTIYRAVPKIKTNAEKLAEVDAEMAKILKRGGDSGRYGHLHDERARLRALPDDAPQAKPTISRGDWVAITKGYARDHGIGALNGEYRIVSKTVKARDIFTNGDSIQEWGYDPQPVATKSSGQPLFNTEPKGDQTQTTAFKRWFGASKVVDADGKPVAVYHGTAKTFDRFDPDKIGSDSGDGFFGRGFYFTNSEDVAKGYGGGWGGGTPNVVHAHLSIQNPLRLSENEANYKKALAASRKALLALKGWSEREAAALRGKGITTISEATMSIPAARFREVLEANGYDGVHVVGSEGSMGADEWVAFRPEQIKSATANNGNFDASKPSILENVEPISKRASEHPADVISDIEAVMNAGADKSLLEQAKAKLAALVPGKVKDALRPTWLAGLTTDMLAELGSDYHANMPLYADFLKAMNADRNELQQDGEDLAEAVRQWGAKNPDQAKALFKLMHQATIDGVDPAKEYQPLQFRFGGKLHEVNRKNVKEAIAAIKQQMRERSGDSKQDMIDEAKKLRAMLSAEPRRRAQYPQLQQKWAALSPEAQGHYTAMRDKYAQRSQMVEDGLVARIEDTDAPDNHKRKLVTVIRQQFETQRLQGVYFPLQRFGQYFVAAEKGETHTFLMFESLNQLEAGVKSLRDKGFTIKAQGLKSQGKAADAPSGTFVAEVIAKLKAAHISESTQDDIYQMYLQALPELSMRKHAIHRQSVPGFDPDAVRGFAFNMLHGAHQIARLRYAHKLADTIKLLKGQQEEHRKDEGADTRKIAAGDAILSELDLRHQWIMNPTDNKATALVSSFGFVYYLGLTPAAALVNLTQTALLTFPYLAARHGPIKAMNQLLAGMRDSIRTGGHLQKVLTDKGELAMHAELQRRGALDKTQAHNLAGISEGGLSGHNPQWAKAMAIIGLPFHKAEVVNREASAIAAYRLARADGATHEQAVDAAARAVNDTHFDYTNQNRARVFQSGTAKTLLMFKQYSLNMTWHLGRMLWQSVKNESPEVKKIARRNLAGVLGMSALFSGTLGLPMMSVTFGVLNAIAASFGDDDEPWDAETEFRAFLNDMLGEGAANIVATGAINPLTGADVASRVSLSQLWFRDADRELDGRGAYYHLLEQAAGPMGGVLKNALVGKQMMDEGHMMRGVETMLPKALKDAVKAQRYAVEGVSNLRGDALIEDVSLRQTLLQLVGFTPDQVASQYDINRSLKNYEQSILKRRGFLLDAFAMALRTDDDEARAAVLEKIRAFNRTNPEIAITTKGIRQSIGARARYSRDAENGISLNRKLSAKLHARVEGDG